MTNRNYTVQCGYAAYHDSVRTVEASSIEEACRLAIEEANQDSAWKSVDHVGDTFIDALAEGVDVDPWAVNGCIGSALPVPEAFTERALHVPALPATPGKATALPDVTVNVTEEILAGCKGRSDYDDNAVAVAVRRTLLADPSWKARLPADFVVEILAQEDAGWLVNLVTRVPPPWDGWARIFWWPHLESVEGDEGDHLEGIDAVMYGEDDQRPFSFRLTMDAI